MVGLSSRRLEMDALRALIAVDRLGGVTRAAEALGLSQSAVSHKIRRLETALGCDLLDRRAQAAGFTAAGRDLLGYARRIVGLHDEALLSLSASPLQGKIALGMTEDTTTTDLARILGRFHRLHPGVRVGTRVRMSLTLQALLAEGAVDLAIMQVFRHEVRPSDLVLYREGLHWVKAAGLPLAEGAPIPFLSFEEACFYRRWAVEQAHDSGLILDTVFECTSAAGIVAGVQAGLGVALLSDRHLAEGIEVIGPQLPRPPDLAYVIRRARRDRNPAVETLVAEIAAETSRYGALQIAPSRGSRAAG